MRKLIIVITLLFSAATAQLYVPAHLVATEFGATSIGDGWLRYDTATPESFPGVPVLTGVRTSGEGNIRIVFDLAHVDPIAMARLRQSGSIAPGQPLLSFVLPPLAYSADTGDALADAGFHVQRTASGLQLTYNYPELSFDVFPLNDPARLVLDVTPVRRVVETRITEHRTSAVLYQQFVYPTPAGGSVVHAATLDPSRGELRVVGANFEGKTLAELATGAVVGINAGYFDTANFRAIGWLLQQGEVHSYPSRNRAVFGVLPGNEVVIDRVEGTLHVHRPDGLTELALVNNPAIEVVRETGKRAGRRSMGALQVVDNVVTDNRVGPLTVPENGYVLVYPPNNRELALLDVGDTVFVELTMEPNGFLHATEAVEAGPLLVRNGENAYEPEREQFQIGQRILDARTQQAAIGVTASGEVVFVVAESMVAAELPELLIALGVVDGLRLDSGGSAALWLTGEIVNRVGALRRIQSAIVFYPGNP